MTSVNHQVKTTYKTNTSMADLGSHVFLPMSIKQDKHEPMKPHIYFIIHRTKEPKNMTICC